MRSRGCSWGRCWRPLGIPVSKIKKDFLDTTGRYLANCYTAVTDACADEVARQLDGYKAALPAEQRWNLGSGKRGKEALTGVLNLRMRGGGGHAGWVGT